MPSNVDQGEPESQSVEDRIADKLFGTDEQIADDQTADEDGGDGDQVAEESGEESEVTTAAVEEVEIEFESWKGKLPAKLKAEIDKGADYTRKTQELAENRKLFETQLRTQQEMQAFNQAAQKELEQYRQIEAQLEQYRNVDLSQIEGETLSRMQMAAANLREERSKLKETLDGKRTEFKQKMLGAWDEMTGKARDVIVKSVPDWDKVAGQVAQYALNEGFPFEVITGHDRTTRERVGPGVVDPVFARTLHKAWQWDKLQASKATATNKAKGAPPVLKPGATDQRSNNQIATMNYRKALNQAKTPSEKQRIVTDRIASKFFR